MKVVEGYIFAPDPYRAGIAPRGLVAKNVGAYLAGAVAGNPTMSVQSAKSAETVARFYDTHEVVAPLRKLLDKKERTSEDLQRSIVFTRMVAALGVTADVAFAKDYFAYLCPKVTEVGHYDELVQLFAALGTSADPAPLRTAMQARLKALAPTRKSNYQDEIAAAELEGNLPSKLERAEAARTRKADILAMADRKARLARLVGIYLDLDQNEGYLEWLQPWTTMRLKRETWASKPDEHVTRAASAKFRADVVTAFKNTLPAIAKLPADERDSLKVRALRAIKFFGGTISAADAKFLAKNSSTQADSLAHEGFMIQP